MKTQRLARNKNSRPFAATEVPNQFFTILLLFNDLTGYARSVDMRIGIVPIILLLKFIEHWLGSVISIELRSEVVLYGCSHTGISRGHGVNHPRNLG
jgi:hypothetical protein